VQPAEKINYTSTLPKEYQDKNPFDVIYDYVSKTICRSGKVQWDGSISELPIRQPRPTPSDRPNSAGYGHIAKQSETAR